MIYAILELWHTSLLTKFEYFVWLEDGVLSKYQEPLSVFKYYWSIVNEVLIISHIKHCHQFIQDFFLVLDLFQFTCWSLVPVNCGIFVFKL